MALIVENGQGLRNAESYASVSYIDAYLAALGRTTENGWATALTAGKEGAARAATQYLDLRWGSRLRGVRRFAYTGRQAIAQYIFSGVPDEDDTITIGDRTYTFVSALSEFVENQILIGGTAQICAENLAAAVNGSATAGTNYSSLTNANVSAYATVQDDGVSVRLTARNVGSEGNDIPLDASVANLTLTSGFVGGTDTGTQALEFPRAALYDAAGIPVSGIPENIKKATAEYAVRAYASPLFSDISVDPSGRAVVREKIGPIETQFAEGSSLAFLNKPYPAADRLLAQYVRSGGVIR